MYRSPIKIIQDQMQMKIENDILKAIQRQSVVVDKEELIKALKYDRGQYEKGYEDAKWEFNEKLDRIVEQLEELEEKALRVQNYDVSFYATGQMHKAIDIVKAGGKDE